MVGVKRELSQRRAIVYVVVGLIVVVGVLYSLVRSVVDPNGDARDKCRTEWSFRATHPQDDLAYWQNLQSCATRKLLPAGYNDPGLYQ